MAKAEVLSITDLRVKLDFMEKQAESDLQSSLAEAGVDAGVSEQYQDLFPEATHDVSKKATKFSLAMLGKNVLQDIKQNRLTQAILAGLVIETGGRILLEGQGDPIKGFTIFFDNLVRWSGSAIQSLDVLLILTAVGAAAVYAGAPAKIVEWITNIQSRKTSEQVSRDAEILKKRSEKETAIKEGTADFDGKIGLNIQIDVGKSDPAMKDLLNLFHGVGLRVMSYWDSKNKFFEIDPAWQKTNNDWTNKEILRKGDVRNAIASVILVSNGDDVFLSSLKQDSSREMQDMTDNEAIGTIHARDAIREEMNLSKIHHILVTNPYRTIGIGVVREGATPYKSKTVGQVLEEVKNVHVIDPDLAVIRQIAEVASRENLPIELVTNEERGKEYRDNLSLAIAHFNERVDAGVEKNKLRMAEGADEKQTLSLIYGSTDEDTIAQVTTYWEEFSKSGDLVAIINDPEKLTRLPKNVKSICVGRLVAEAVYQEFYELVKSGEIKI